ncbi:MAG: hypothetical protein EOO05_16450 [Chitinophagaceae bacterium]|nr:MAG: hypothetical protein EOO05_16450 [Chitinophagaceae bacterium]
MLKPLFVFYSIIVLSGCGRKPASLEMPADWLNQAAVFLTYTGNPDDAKTTGKVMAVCDQLIEQVAPHLRMYILVNEEWNLDSMMRVFTKKQYNISNIQLVPVKNLFDMGVVRDYGPIIVKDKEGRRKMMRFEWNYVGADFIHPDTAWERYQTRTRDQYFTQIGKLLDMEVVRSPLVLEGGEIETNGAGTALIVDSFNNRRNPFFTTHAVDSLLELSLGITNVIHLREGVAEDPPPWQSRISGNIYGYGVGGHVDEFARFVNRNTILLAMPAKEETLNDPIKKITYERMQVNYQILSAARDQDGQPFTIIEVPLPDVIPEEIRIDTTDRSHPGRFIRSDYPDLKQGDTVRFLPAVSYLNYIILNDLVIIPKYNRAGGPASSGQKDEQVKRIFTRLFPAKKIIQLDPTGLNYVGGGFHCWTQQVPVK